MKKRSFAVVIMLLCAGLALKASASRPQPVAEPQTPPATPDNATLERFIFITVPELFGELDRAPVRFFHEKHTKALEPEGCEACHPAHDNGTFEFTFPKQKCAWVKLVDFQERFPLVDNGIAELEVYGKDL